MKLAIVDSRISSEEIINLKKLNLNLILCPTATILYNAVCGHPDMLLHPLDTKTIMVHKDMNIGFINKLESYGIKTLLSKDSLQTNYPSNIILNSVSLDNLFIHNLKYTDKNLLSINTNKILVNVKQGYAKCSIAVVSGKAIMTSDPGIAKALTPLGIDVLLLPPRDILLPGLDYGFIGGCCGLIDKDLIAFYGDLNYYAYGNEVLNFLKKHGVKPVYLRKDKLIDRGSIFVIDVSK